MGKEYEQQVIKIAEHYGYDNQSNMLMEECSELIQAMNKHKRLCQKDRSINSSWTECVDAIIEEMADVQLMMDQMTYLLSINPKYIDMCKNDKAERAMQRISEAKALNSQYSGMYIDRSRV